MNLIKIDLKLNWDWKRNDIELKLSGIEIKIEIELIFNSKNAEIL